MNELEKWLSDVSYLKRQKERMSKDILNEERFKKLVNSIELPQNVINRLSYKPNMSLWDLYMQITHLLTIYNATLKYHISASKLLLV
jgi:hypothetical protein